MMPGVSISIVFAVTLAGLDPAPASDTTVAATARVAPAACRAPLALTRKNTTLQRNLEAALASAKLGRYTQRHHLAVAVIDLTRPDELAYAGVNDDDMVYAASLPKIAILLADAQAAADGRLEWTEEHDRRLSAMITESSNVDATWGASLVGFGGIEAAVRDPRYCFYDNTHGGLWVGRAYAKGGETYPDPLRDLVHGATARQAARFYALLDGHQLVSHEWSDHLMALMGPPKHHHKFVKGLEDRPDVTFVARKSGTWLDFHADSALVQHGDDRYVAVALSELRNGEDVLQRVIRAVDDVIVAGKHRKPRPAPRAAVAPRVQRSDARG
jgi:beta-lactamase class A